MKQELLLGVGLFVLVTAEPAVGQTSRATDTNAFPECAYDPSNGPNKDFGPCLYLLSRQSSEIEARLAGDIAESEKEDLKKDQKLTALAVGAFNDLSTRRAKADALALSAKEAGQRAATAPNQPIRQYEETLKREADAAEEGVREKIPTVEAGAFAYAQSALTSYRGKPLYQAAASNPAIAKYRSTDPERAECARMLDEADVVIDVSRCRRTAIASSSLSIPGGDIKIPGSVLDPIGFNALVNASDAGGGVEMTLSRERKVRGRLLSVPQPDQKLPRPWSWTASAGVVAGSGTLFQRNDDLPDADQIDSKVKLKGSIGLNFFSRETYSAWKTRRDTVRSKLVAECKADQQQSKPTFVSSCVGESLNDWVYAPDDKGDLRRPESASLVDDLYYASGSKVPLFGFGVASEISRVGYDYLLPDRFQQFFNPAAGFDDAFKKAAVLRSSAWLASLSPYGYLRLTEADAALGLAVIPSYTVAKTLGYAPDYEKPLFCPGIVSGTPFTTTDCRRFNGQAPKDLTRETWAGELRSSFPLAGFDVIMSPKLSWSDVDRKDEHPWLASLPVLVFTDAQKTTAVGFKADWGFGQLEPPGADVDDSWVVKLILQKTFSLTGN